MSDDNKPVTGYVQQLTDELFMGDIESPTWDQIELRRKMLIEQLKHLGNQVAALTAENARLREVIDKVDTLDYARTGVLGRTMRLDPYGCGYNDAMRIVKSITKTLKEATA